MPTFWPATQTLFEFEAFQLTSGQTSRSRDPLLFHYSERPCKQTPSRRLSLWLYIPQATVGSFLSFTQPRNDWKQCYKTRATLKVQTHTFEWQWALKTQRENPKKVKVLAFQVADGMQGFGALIKS